MSSREGTRTLIRRFEDFVVAWDEFVAAGHQVSIHNRPRSFRSLLGQRVADSAKQSADEEFAAARERVTIARRVLGPVRVSPERPSGISEALAVQRHIEGRGDR